MNQLSEPDAIRALLTTPADYVRWGATAFEKAGLSFGHGLDNALDEAFYLVTHVLSLPHELPPVYMQATLLPEERVQVHELLERRIRTRKPAAYLIGEARFCGLDFEVDERVLVPRSPIGEMIEQAFAPWLPQTPESILDLCTGSGCIAVACACAFPDADVDAAEIDDGAIEILRRNLKRHGLEDRIVVRHGDLFAPVGNARYDLIVSNPPYVPTGEWQALSDEYRHEPRIALDAGEDGMAIVDRILREAPDHLSDNGVLVCEIGGSQEEFHARFPDFPGFWPEFERGGDGVFVISRDELQDWLHRI
jgi:ribosomal protein L3 glutamine methyltransferase